jgi:D-psicose/D-tagatose/L-ribulose 3-epimerase
MKFGVHAGLWMARWTDDLAPIIRTVADLGYDGVETSLLGMTTEKAGAVRTIAEDAGLEITCTTGLSASADVSSSDPAIRAEGLAYLRWAFDTATALGSHMLSGVLYAPWGAFAPGGKAERTDRSIDAWRSLAPELEGRDLRIALEAINRFETDMLNTAGEALAMTRAIGSPSIGVLLDIFHLNIEEKDIGAAIRSAGSELFHFHVSDNDRSVPGSGHAPWDDAVTGLRSTGYDGWIVAEMFVMAGNPASADLNIWRDLATDPTDAARAALAFMRETFR